MKIHLVTFAIVNNFHVRINRVQHDSIISLEVIFFNTAGETVTAESDYHHYEEIESLLHTAAAWANHHPCLYNAAIDELSKILNYPNIQDDLIQLNIEWPSDIESATVGTYREIEIYNVAYHHDNQFNHLYFFKKTPELTYYKTSYIKTHSAAITESILALDHFGPENDEMLLERISRITHSHKELLSKIISEKFNI